MARYKQLPGAESSGLMFKNIIAAAASISLLLETIMLPVISHKKSGADFLLATQFSPLCSKTQIL
jgi:hypothetical protein